jgi:hypothetical protein
MTQTIFTAQAKECRGSANFWPILVGVSLVLVVGVAVFTEGRYVAFGPSPLVVAIIYFATRNKKNDVKVFVNQRGSDFEFGYHDKSNTIKGPYPILEYTYWCYERSATMNGWNYDLYFQINTKSETATNGAATIYFKQEITARNPPAGWDRTKQQINEKPGVFLVPDLPALAALIDAVPADEITAPDENNL